MTRVYKTPLADGIFLQPAFPITREAGVVNGLSAADCEKSRREKKAALRAKDELKKML